MKLPPEKLLEIEQKAQAILNQYGITKYPVDLDTICRNEGIGVFKVDFSTLGGDYISVDGIYSSKDEGKQIFTNTNNHDNRRRFTVAHELGHHFLNHTLKDNAEIYRFNITTNDDPQETEANEFAAALLMPREALFAFDLEKTPREDIAAFFGVSNEALYYRLKNLGLLNV